LIKAVGQAHRAVTTGDCKGIATREVDQHSGGRGGHAA
jgi:hypothetical protein